MIKTEEELLKAKKYLNKRAMSCTNTDNPPKKAIVKAITDDMSIEQFNNEVVPELDFENKYKLGSMLRQARYNQEHPKKSFKISKKVADKFDEAKGDKSIDDFILELLGNLTK